ncbi:PAS domain-containing sensor histidine kinase [Halopiger djelfimassiliensis]|uniref:PAS domain-containing sensor histidine kinase n=1 Tax=Halopiger djelfimassiliensis TaxID=1293047 RepID=UPI000677E02D|nr:PAS domain-containing sensor histidine kinase [Halopiger djelfimassiliensis]
MNGRIRRTLERVCAVAVSPVALVGVGLLGLAGSYAAVFGGAPEVLSFELFLPTVAGLGLVRYGTRTREPDHDRDHRRTEIVTACALGLGALSTLFCFWVLLLVRLRTGVAGSFAQPSMSALSAGTAVGALLGHVYVERTRYHRTNERLTHAVNASRDGIAIIVDAHHVYVNDAYAGLYSLPDGSALEGRPWTDLYTTESRASIEREVIPALAERNVWRGTLTGKRTDGTTFPQAVTVSVLEGGEANGYVVIARDLTDQREREQRIQVLNRVLRHNLRNSFTVIRAHARRIGERDERLDRNHVGPILDEIDDLLSTAEKARDIERTLERCDRSAVIEATDAVRTVVDRATDAYPDARIGSRIEAPVRNGEPPTIDERVVDALDELVDNAIEHHPASRSNQGRPSTPQDSDPSSSVPDAPTVEVAVRTTEYDDGTRLEFTVTDDGTGIPEAERRAILDGEETQLDHGSGIGLWIVTWIVRNAGGNVRFTPRPGGGTTVTLSFPNGGSEPTTATPSPSSQ